MTVTFERTAVPEWQKDPDDSGWFKTYLETRNAARAAAAPKEVEPDSDEEEEDPLGRVVRPAEPMDVAEMGQSPRGYWMRLQTAPGGWKVEAQVTETEHPETRWKTDSKAGVKKPHEQGEIRRTLHRRIHMWMKGSLTSEGRPVAGFVMEYEMDMGSVKPGWKAKAFHFWDMVTDERAFTTAATEFDAWLSVFAPKPPPKTLRKKKEPTPTEAEQQEAHFRALRNGEAEWQPES